jgi:hypothetical protein
MSRLRRAVQNLKRPLPAWLVIVLIAASALATASVFVAPAIFGPKGDFQMQPNSSSNRTLIYPNQVIFKVAVSSVNGFSGIVALTSSAPVNVNVLIVTSTPNNPVILLGTSDTASLTVQATAAGNYTITVTGNSGRLSHSVTLSLVVQDIGFSANPSSLVCGSNNTANSTITMTSRNGLSGTLNLAGDWHLNTVTPSPTSVYLPEGGSAQTRVTVTCGRLYPPPGNCISFYATIQMVGTLDYLGLCF